MSVADVPTAKVAKNGKKKKGSFLTDEQKKKHHIESEHKRRKAIRDAFERITDLVPGLSKDDARSEILVLAQAGDYLSELHSEHEALLAALEAKGVAVPSV